MTDTVDSLIVDIERAGYTVEILRGPVGHTTIWIHSKGIRSKVVRKLEGEGSMVDLLRQAKSELS